MAEEKPFAGRRILVAEDNLFAAMELERLLVDDLGCHLVGPAAKVEVAMRLACEEPLDGALLDVDLHGEPTFAVAEQLEQRGIPVAFATGYASDEVFPAAFRGHPRLDKPFGEAELRRVLAALLQRRP
jgi:two-component system, chemotaxis family, sensor kinase Cph1